MHTLTHTDMNVWQKHVVFGKTHTYTHQKRRWCQGRLPCLKLLLNFAYFVLFCHMSDFFATCSPPKQALSYNMIENNFCISDHWNTSTLFHHDLRTIGNIHPVAGPRMEKTKETEVTGQVPGQDEERENWPPLPRILLANVQSLDNKPD